MTGTLLRRVLFGLVALFLAAPLIVHPVFALLGLTEGTATTFQIATQARADAQNAWSNILSPAAMPGSSAPSTIAPARNCGR